MVSKRAKLNNPRAAAQILNRFLADTLPDLKIAAQRLERLTSDIRCSFQIFTHGYLVEQV